MAYWWTIWSSLSLWNSPTCSSYIKEKCSKLNLSYSFWLLSSSSSYWFMAPPYLWQQILTNILAFLFLTSNQQLHCSILFLHISHAEPLFFILDVPILLSSSFPFSWIMAKLLSAPDITSALLPTVSSWALFWWIMSHHNHSPQWLSTDVFLSLTHPHE